MMAMLGRQDALLWLVSIWWLALLIWCIATGIGSRRVWWALVAFALSATLYVGPVARFVASIVGSSKACDQFENLWGVAVSGVVVTVLCIWANRTLAVCVAVVTVIALIAMVVLAAHTTPSPVGCVATNTSVPWYSPYWWIITVTHIAAAIAATVICARDATAIGNQDWAATLAVAGIAVGFLMSAGFWLLIWISLVADTPSPALWASANVFPLTVLFMTLSAVVAAAGAAATTMRHRTAITVAWREYRLQFAITHPGAPVPSRWDIIGPWWSHPAQSLHQVHIQTSDLALSRRSSTRLQQPREVLNDGGTS